MATRIQHQGSSDSHLGLANAQNNLTRLDRQDWLRWATTVVVCLALTADVFALAAPTLRRDWLDQTKLDISVMGVFALVLLFGSYAAYQQVLITRLRHELTSQVGMAATLEVLKPAPGRKEGDVHPRRDYIRFHLDLRVTIEADRNGRMITVFGRSSDLSEGGVGIVIPESLAAGESVIVHLPIGEGSEKIAFPAVVRHQRGFYHGCEFVGIGERERMAIRSACAGAVPVVAFRHD